MQQTDKKANDRYFTNQQEFQVLKDNIETYFSFPKRSQDRKRINTETTEKLNQINPGHWNDKIVRVWFTNNRERILNPNDPSNPPETPIDDSSNQNSINPSFMAQYPNLSQIQRPILPFGENNQSQPFSLPQVQPSQQFQQPPAQTLIQPIPAPIQQPIISPPPILNDAAAKKVLNEPNYQLVDNTSSTDISMLYEPEALKQNTTIQNDSYPLTQNNMQQSYQNSNSYVKTEQDSNTIENKTSHQAFSSEDEEDKNENEEDDEFPQPPDFDQVITGGKMDQLKWEMYNKFLPNCYKYFKKLKSIKDPKDRLEKQERLEDIFVQTLNVFQDKVGVKTIYSKDITTLFIHSRDSYQLRRTFSVTTQRYNNENINTEPAKPELVEGCPYIYYKKILKPPARLNNSLKSFYYGKYETGNRICTDLGHIEASTFTPAGDLLCVVFDTELRVHHIVLGENDADSQSGFFFPANSMFAQDDTVWIQGDVRVRAFDLNSYQCIDTLYIRKEIINKSAITIWNGNIAVGVDEKIYLYSMKPSDTPIKEDPNFRKRYEDQARRMGLELTSIDWTHGRKCKKQIIDDKITKITSMIAVGQYLIVASEDYPVIHVYDSSENIVARLTGHTMGITSLHSSDDNSFYSGSKDTTLKRWSLIDFTPIVGFLVNYGEITAITTSVYFNQMFLFSGSNDSRVNICDITNKKSIFEIDLTNGYIPISLLFTPSNATLSIIAVQKDDVNDQGMMQLYTNPKNERHDQIQTFTFAKE